MSFLSLYTWYVIQAQKEAAHFKVGMRLEAKDRKNLSLICVATIAGIRDGELLIHFDGWSNRYDYWCQPDSIDIHPVGWCEQKHQELQKPHGNNSLISFMFVILIRIIY